MKFHVTNAMPVATVLLAARRTRKSISSPFKMKVQEGFTLVELVLVLGIVSIILSIATFNLVHSQQSTNIDSAVQQFIADFRQQQVAAMEGDTQSGSSSLGYGIYCSGNNYTLFHGNSYDPASTSNFTVAFSGPLQFTSQKTVVFGRVSGEVQGFSSVNGGNTIGIEDTSSNTSVTIQFNQLGVITNVY